MSELYSVPEWLISLFWIVFNPLKLKPTNQPKNQLRAGSCASARHRPLLSLTIPAYETHCCEIGETLPFICGSSWRSWVSKVGNIEWKERGFENFARRVADIARGLSSKTSTRQGNYQWLPVRPRGGLRQDSCAYFVKIEFFLGDYLCVIGMPDLRWGHGAVVVNWGGGGGRRDVYNLFFKKFFFGLI
jgi:hypothetical protein